VNSPQCSKGSSEAESIGDGQVQVGMDAAVPATLSRVDRDAERPPSTPARSGCKRLQARALCVPAMDAAIEWAARWLREPDLGEGCGLVEVAVGRPERLAVHGTWDTSLDPDSAMLAALSLQRACRRRVRLREGLRRKLLDLEGWTAHGFRRVEAATVMRRTLRAHAALELSPAAGGAWHILMNAWIVERVPVSALPPSAACNARDLVQAAAFEDGDSVIVVENAVGCDGTLSHTLRLELRAPGAEAPGFAMLRAALVPIIEHRRLSRDEARACAVVRRAEN
jgi:hypothetical protein